MGFVHTLNNYQIGIKEQLINTSCMDIASTGHESVHAFNSSVQKPESYLNMLEPEILASFTPAQLQAIHLMLETAIPKPSPKIVDLRFGIDLVFSRFYVVLLLGQEKRRYRRRYIPRGIARVGNTIVAVLLLLSMNLLVSLSILLLLYLAKSAVGIDLFPQEHLSDQFQRF